MSYLCLFWCCHCILFYLSRFNFSGSLKLIDYFIFKLPHGFDFADAKSLKDNSGHLKEKPLGFLKSVWQWKTNLFQTA